jgi:hypothetical protein
MRSEDKSFNKEDSRGRTSCVRRRLRLFPFDRLFLLEQKKEEPFRCRSVSISKRNIKIGKPNSFAAETVDLPVVFL